MRPLADRILDLLPTMDEPLAGDVAEYIKIDISLVRAAFERLEADGRAKIVRRGNGLHLVPAGYSGRICLVCRAEFDPDALRKSKGSTRKTCSAKCRAALGWIQTKDREARIAAQSVWSRSPEGRAARTERNHERWAKPEEHEKLSEENRKRWADPITKMVQSVGHQRRMSTPEARERQAKNVKARWDSEQGRDKLVKGIQASKRTPEARAKFSELLRERWKDPVMRAKYTAGNQQRNAARSKALLGTKQTPEHVAKRMESRKRGKP